MTDRPAPLLAFVDIETSGDDPLVHEVLEGACVLVDPVTGETVGEPGLDSFDIAIEPAQSDWPDRMPQVVGEMHSGSGLLRDVTTRGVNRTVADKALHDWIVRNSPGDRPLWLAGAGVAHFEVRWLPEHLPALSGLLCDYSAGCRVIDTSATRRHLELAGVECPQFNARKPHRALPDVWLHVAEYRWQRELFQILAGLRGTVAAVPVWDPFGDGTVDPTPDVAR